MWDKYIYLIGGIIFTGLALACCAYRRDLAKKAFLVGSITVPISFVEFLFSRDYWHPPVVFGNSHLSFEDFLFDFGIIAFVFILYPVLTRTKFSAVIHKTRLKTYVLFILIAAAALGFLNVGLGFNSVILCSIFLVCFTTVMWMMRPDLIKQSLVTGLVLICFTTVLYAIFFDILAPDWWHKYWYLWHTRYSVTILGNIPLTELGWYFAWGIFGSISFPFVEGRALVPLSAPDRTTKDKDAETEQSQKAKRSK